MFTPTFMMIGQKLKIHVFQQTRTIFELNSPKNVTPRVFTCFLFIQIEKTAPPNGGHVFSPIWTIFELETNFLTKFHDDMTINVTSRVFTCFHYIHMKKTAPLPGGHVFSPIWTIFELVRDINKANVFTKFHDDWAKIVTSRLITRKTAPPTGCHVFQQIRI
ncbi:hypothetical protein DPMN_106825 [Dreissena polymorpha]|uniref:Uncharacterized protein n=1 Tax=Dreissena polymorpha TaxID=45954 RepID=A0A9D4K5V4_DREPO|nr:hypothetical protein DPMN_106825 [Dreissena polymorpha]